MGLVLTALAGEGTDRARHRVAQLCQRTGQHPLCALDQSTPAISTSSGRLALSSVMLGSRPEYTWEATPAVIKGRLYTTAGTRRDVVCVDAANGELLWMFRKDEGQRARNAPRPIFRPRLAYWTDGQEERILYVTTGYQLWRWTPRQAWPFQASAKTASSISS
jgi:outer membrane protein assembly factor BamB